MEDKSKSVTEPNNEDEPTVHKIEEKKVYWNQSLIGNAPQFLTFFAITFFSFCLCLRFIPFLRFALLPEFNLLQEIDTINMDYKAMAKVNEEWAKKMLTLDDIKKDIELLKKQNEEETAKLQTLVEGLSKQPFAENLSNQLTEGEKLKKELLTALTKRQDLKDILEKIKNKKPKEEFKVFVDLASEIDYTQALEKDEIIKKFDQILKASKAEKDDDKSLEGFSSQFIAQIKRNIKITVDGKEENNALKDILEKAKKQLDQNNLQGAIDAVSSVNNILDVQKWIKEVKSHLALDALIQKLQEFKGPYVE